MRKTIVASVFLCLMLYLLPGTAFAQSRTVKGKVTSEAGTPLPGVTVAVQGTARATPTSTDGNFAIIAETGQTLSFSSVGYETKT
ncbi:carboxypeptidase-like regulatory domain-containing protein [Niabella sp. W65]|nr:carboxypeptidase-like regulatory domain-containing protein [Niabella sp. W65]MCH7361944.1 carboxypeptidase-like regulatory domain-containing protein [Niabella sp. W65]ULT45699.1 carboxypeptidase-like regulatory domain-containing protein [Niabella sp. I65]